MRDDQTHEAGGRELGIDALWQLGVAERLGEHVARFPDVPTLRWKARRVI